MIEWLGKNIGTLIVSLALLAIILAILLKLRRDKKQGAQSRLNTRKEKPDTPVNA